jgi:hypothetical protein
MEFTSTDTALGTSVCTLRMWTSPWNAFRQRGAKILAEPREFPGARFAYVGAPDGVIIEFLEHRQWAAFLGPGALAHSPAPSTHQKQM